MTRSRPVRGARSSGRAGVLGALMLAVALVAASPSVGASAPDPADDVPASTAQAQDAPLTWGIQPASQSGVGTRPAFAYDLAPGSGVSDAVRITNYSESAITLDLYAADAFNNEQGGFDVSTTEATVDDVGSWVRLEEPEITVPARAMVDVPFTLDVPDDAEPGDHAGGIVTSLSAMARDEEGNQVRVDHRVASRIYVRVDGPLRAVLVVQDVNVVYDGTVNPVGRGSASVSFTVHNAGNVRLAARQHVALNGPFGLGRQELDLDDLPELLPGSRVRVTVPVVDPSDPAAGRIGLWPTVRVRAVVTLDPIGTVPADRVVASARTWAVPWSLLVLGAAGAAAVGVRRFRRTRSPRNGENGQIAPPAEPLLAERSSAESG